MISYRERTVTDGLTDRTYRLASFHRTPQLGSNTVNKIISDDSKITSTVSIPTNEVRYQRRNNYMTICITEANGHNVMPELLLPTLEK